MGATSHRACTPHWELGLHLRYGQLWPQLYFGRVTGHRKGEFVKEGTTQRLGGQRDAVAIIQVSEEAPRTRHL